MPRSPKRNQMRQHLAYLAARIMADGGVQDYVAAKLKAARQARVPDTHCLPDNREIEEALRAYQALYQRESQATALLRLRRQAVRLMELFALFNPHLTGSVLAGTAGEHSDINLQLYCDSPKDLEVFMVNNRIPYQAGYRRFRLGGRQVDVPLFSLEFEDTQVSLSVYHTDDLRIVQKRRADGSTVERARLSQVRALIEGDQA
ncbi:MAG TPA: hypothetical protein VNL15_08855 [Dehalococcoidia bacterium]|nr:hypothetical protein [Dehalococcoidia bacterium]